MRVWGVLVRMVGQLPAQPGVPRLMAFVQTFVGLELEALVAWVGLWEVGPPSTSKGRAPEA